MTIKKLKFTKKTATFTFDIAEPWENKTDQTKKAELIALSLLFGTFNPLRKFSSDKDPIQLNELSKCTEQYQNMIFDLLQNIDADLLSNIDQITEI